MVTVAEGRLSTLCCWEAAVHTFDESWKNMDVKLMMMMMICICYNSESRMADANSRNGQTELFDKKLNGNTNNHASDASNDKIHSDNLNGRTFDSQNKELDICQNREQEKLPQNGIKNGAQHQVNKAALDGGWGWVVVACSMMATTVVGGSYITFSLLYVDLVEAFSTTKAVAGWIGSIHIGSGNFFGSLMIFFLCINT